MLSTAFVARNALYQKIAKLFSHSSALATTRRYDIAVVATMNGHTVSDNTSPARFQQHCVRKAVVRSIPGEPMMTITLEVGGRQRNLDRPKTELLERPLLRISKSAFAPAEAKNAANRAKQRQIQDAMLAALYAGPSQEHPVIDPSSVSNEEAWLHGRLLAVGGFQYLVDLNPPTVDRLELNGQVAVGVPLVPMVELQFAELNACFWQWQRKSIGDDNEWIDIKKAFHHGYVPTQDDLGCVLRVACTPAAGMRQGDTVYSNEQGPVVQIQLSNVSSLSRHTLTATPCFSPDFRVVTYNLLADQYASTEDAKSILFKHCPPQFLEASYRRPIILKELLGYNADIICLQEVDERMFTAYLQPTLHWAGFCGVYTNKAGSVREGEAMFWRSSRFRLKARKDIVLRSLYPSGEDVLKGDDAKYFMSQCPPELLPMLKSSPALCTALQKVGTIAQLVLLEPVVLGIDKPLSDVCVINTHLFFHGSAPHIRSIHVWSILQEMKTFLAEIAKTKSAGCIFVGDLNSDINDGIPGALELLASGFLPGDYWDWKFGVDFQWDRNEENAASLSTTPPHLPHDATERVTGVDLETGIPLVPIDGLRSGVTNYVQGYQGLLDYVWFDFEQFALQRQFAVPSIAEMGGKFLPNKDFPSDHMAVVADLSFRSEKKEKGEATSGGTSSIGDEFKGSGTILPAALHNVKHAVTCLKNGEMLAVPTDTLYGLAACVTSSTGLERIYSAKQRESKKPLAICVADHEDIGRYCHIESLPEELLKDLLPGKVTLLLRRRADAPVSQSLNPTMPAVLGIRIPDQQFLRAVCRQHGGALALTSANVSGGRSSLDIHEFSELWSECSIVFDGGKLKASRSGSTIIDLTKVGEYDIHRAGDGLTELISKLEGAWGLTRREGGVGQA
jgi:2',5'-phosphodiesterase